MHFYRVPLIVVALVCSTSGCERQASEGNGGTAMSRLEHLVDGDQDSEQEEQHEAEQEKRMLADAMQSLGHFRTSSCAAAIATIEAMLRRGDGRWHERTAANALPEDLLKLLTDAELYRHQAQSLCATDAQRPRFEELSLAMGAIWKYPSHISREQLDQSLLPLATDAKERS